MNEQNTNPINYPGLWKNVSLYDFAGFPKMAVEKRCGVVAAYGMQSERKAARRYFARQYLYRLLVSRLALAGGHYKRRPDPPSAFKSCAAADGILR